MEKDRKLILTAVVLFVVLCIHGPSAWAAAGTPVKVVKDFTKAYFMLDPSMAGYLSQDALMNEDSVDMVDLYLGMKSVEARDRGYRIDFLKKLPIDIKTKVLNVDDSSAKIQVNATTIRNINPLFRIVGYVFGLLWEYEAQDVITLVKENGEWKIGPGAFDMPL